MFKNAPACAGASAGRQMQVELCEIPFAGAPEILRVGSRRIRSDFLPRRRVGEPAGCVLVSTLQRRRMKGTQQMGVFQQLLGLVSVLALQVLGHVLQPTLPFLSHRRIGAAFFQPGDVKKEFVNL
jgi:hypothetical protein